MQVTRITFNITYVQFSAKIVFSSSHFEYQISFGRKFEEADLQNCFLKAHLAKRAFNPREIAFLKIPSQVELYLRDKVALIQVGNFCIKIIQTKRLNLLCQVGNSFLSFFTLFIFLVIKFYISFAVSFCTLSSTDIFLSSFLLAALNSREINVNLFK